MDGLDAESTAAAERRSEPGAGVALHIVRLAGTPSKSRSSEHGRLRACELAVRDAPRDVACRGERPPASPPHGPLARRRRLAVPTHQSPLFPHPRPLPCYASCARDRRAIAAREERSRQQYR